MTPQRGENGDCSFQNTWSTSSLLLSHLLPAWKQGSKLSAVLTFGENSTVWPLVVGMSPGKGTPMAVLRLSQQTVT